MPSYSLAICVALLGVVAQTVASAAEPAKPSTRPTLTKLPPKDKLHLYVLFGQSNMAGRGVIEDQDRVPFPRVFTLTKEETWVPAVEPIHFDRPDRLGASSPRPARAQPARPRSAAPDPPPRLPPPRPLPLAVAG